MRIEGKVRKQQTKRNIYEIAFNKEYRDVLPSRPVDGCPIQMVVAGTEYSVRVFKSEKSRYVWISSHVKYNGARLKMYEVLTPLGFNPGDSIFFEYDTGKIEVVLDQAPICIAQEIEKDATFIEGAKRTIEVNAYERDYRARSECIAIYGVTCAICGTNLKELYRLDKPCIEVHHLVPLSELKDGYEVKPKRDLRPVCPNCHTVLHLRKPPFTIEEVRAMLRRE